MSCRLCWTERFLTFTYLIIPWHCREISGEFVQKYELIYHEVKKMGEAQARLDILREIEDTERLASKLSDLCPDNDQNDAQYIGPVHLLSRSTLSNIQVPACDLDGDEKVSPIGYSPLLAGRLLQSRD